MRLRIPLIRLCDDIPLFVYSFLNKKLVVKQFSKLRNVFILCKSNNETQHIDYRSLFFAN